MAYEKKPVILKWDPDSRALDPKEPSFETVLNTTCERLREMHVQYSLRRIQEMDEVLQGLEKEMDEYILRLGAQGHE